VKSMNKRDCVDLAIYAANPIGMRVSGLKEMRDGGLHVPFSRGCRKVSSRGVFFSIYIHKTLIPCGFQPEI